MIIPEALSRKFEIRSTKSEKNTKAQNTNFQNKINNDRTPWIQPFDWVIEDFEFRICFEFRYSDFSINLFGSGYAGLGVRHI